MPNSASPKWKPNWRGCREPAVGVKLRGGADTIVRPGADAFVAPIVSAISVPVHHVPVPKGTDVDQPHDLAKPVTVPHPTDGR